MVCNARWTGIGLVAEKRLTLIWLELSGYGGIQTYARHFTDACLEFGYRVHLVSLDAYPSKLDFLLAARQAVRQSEHLVLGHVHLLPLLWWAPPACRVQLLLYGIEVWRPLAWWRRRFLHRVDSGIAISDYTARQATRSLGVRPIWVVRCTSS